MCCSANVSVDSYKNNTCITHNATQLVILWSAIRTDVDSSHEPEEEMRSEVRSFVLLASSELRTRRVLIQLTQVMSTPVTSLEADSTQFSLEASKDFMERLRLPCVKSKQLSESFYSGNFFFLFIRLSTRTLCSLVFY